jgi:hypothetical protein
VRPCGFFAREGTVTAKRTFSSSASTPAYHAQDAYGNKITLQILDRSGNATLGSSSNFVVLNQQGAMDLLSAFTVYANTGTLI